MQPTSSTFFQKINQWVHSRTVWTIVITVLVNTLNVNAKLIPAQWMDFINPVLGLIATYFHVNPSQPYQPPATTMVAQNVGMDV